MPLPSKRTLALISWLAEREESELLDLAQLRALTPAQCETLATMAQALLSPESTEATLAQLPREELHTLHSLVTGGSASGETAELARWGLVDDSSATPRVMGDEGLGDSLSRLKRDATPPALTVGVPDPAELGRSATRAWGMLCMIDDLLEVLSRLRITWGRDNALAATARKTLLAELGEGFDLDGALGLARTGGLLTFSTGVVAVSDSAPAWRELSPEDQWAVIAQAWFAAAPPWLTGTLQDVPGVSWPDGLDAYAGYAYPMADREALTALTTQAQALGFLAPEVATPWALALAQGQDATASLAAALPPSVSGVYAHEDLTLLAPGPLGKDHRVTLSRLALRELGGLVPRFRLTAASVLQALNRGYPPETVLDDLRHASANPLPQAMVALVEDTLRRASDITLSMTALGTIITTSTAERAEELLIDPRLAMVGLEKGPEGTLVSSWPLERVYSALHHSSYPALVSEVADETPPREPVAVHAEVTPEALLLDAICSLVASIKQATAKGVPAGLGSMIEVAIAGKIPFEVVVEMPDASLITIIMEPRALGGGRLRGVELSNAMERTLPVSRIRSLNPVSTQA